MMTTETTARTVNHGIAGPTERNTVDCGKVRTASTKRSCRYACTADFGQIIVCSVKNGCAVNR
jgi:hypothetical protein